MKNYETRIYEYKTKEARTKTIKYQTLTILKSTMGEFRVLIIIS